MKDIKEPLLILIGLFVLIGFAYAPIKKSNLANENRNVPSSIGEVEETPVKQTPQNTTGEIKNVDSRHSPFYGKIRMSSIYGLRSSDPSTQYFSISNKLGKGETANITGWYFKSEVTGYYAVIGKASLLPFPFTHTESDIVMKQGDRVYIIKGFSPIGVSFRTNKCTGYFEENRTFYPSLPLQCPRASDENLPRFSNDLDRDDECIRVIQRVSRCTTVNGEFLRDLPDTVTTSCKDYMSTQIGYNSCVAKHLSDADFVGNEYRIYLNKFGPLWRESRETITLYDQNGLIVDSYSY